MSSEYSPYYLSMRVGREHTVIYLAERGADINTTDQVHLTPLHFAARYVCVCPLEVGFASQPMSSSNGQLNVVRVLLDLGADLDAKCAQGNSPFEYAVKKEHMECAEYLAECAKKKKAKALQEQLTCIDVTMFAGPSMHLRSLFGKLDGSN